MFSLMEILDQLNSCNNLCSDFSYSIVPTVLLPLAFLSTGITVVATFIAGLFGIKLKAEGPKKLLEVLLKPKILISAMIFNVLIYGGMEAYQYLKHGPVPLLVQELVNKDTSFSKAPLKAQEGMIWQQSVEEGIFASGVVVGDELFVGSKEGNLFVIDINSGAIKNKIFFGKFLSPTPVYYKGYLYFGEGLHASHHMRVYKFDPTAKKVVGSFQTKGHTEIFPVITEIDGKDYLFQSAGGDGLYAIDPNSMELIWQYKGGHMDAFVLVKDNAVYVASGVPEEDIGKARPYAYKLDVKSGKLLWKEELPLSSWYGPVATRDNICFIQGELHVKSELGGLVCLNSIGQQVSSISIDSPVIGKPIVFDDLIVFNDFDGRVYAWNSITSKLEWKYASREKKIGYNYSSVKYDGEKLIFSDRKGKISYLSLNDGKVINSIEFGDESVFADSLILDQGHLIFGMKGSIKYYKNTVN
ncbi:MULTISPECIES: PQQ-binding-like beta-propeller repeat protein [unclassified Halobacteriovorax]|uniref:outer membrane protein assembly factor BamB family protein n=1 Tax=unclassified Halobacteriovorax TaxID=2639665 RepID=UPI00399B2FFF